MARRRGSRQPTQVESLKHKDTRKNIPTEELRDFVPDEPDDAVNTLRWPRDPALDPQLVWQGKDDLDGEDLAVPALPIYIQEKLHPHAIIEDLRRTSQDEAAYQLDWFDDFNGLDNFQHKLEFYQHDQYWQNRLILGDSLLVMASLADKEGLRGKIQCIYMDPPYGVKFNSNWQVSTRRRDVRDGRAEDTTRQPEQVRAFRDTWKLGVNSYLTYLRDRLTVARDLLSETGSIFVQIGDENAHRVRAVLDEVFGAENHIAKIVVAKTSSQTSQHLAGIVDYVLFYARKKESLKYRQLNKDKKLGEKGTTQYVWQLSDDLQESRISKKSEPDGHVFAADNLRSQSGGSTTRFGYDLNGLTYHGSRGGWKTNLEGMKRLERANRIKPIGNSLMYRRFLDDFAVYPIANLWDDVLATGFTERKVYVVQSSQKLVQRCVLMATDPGDLVLDPTCGSGTTAYVAEQWGRRWITIDTSRVALALARTRIMAARYPYYLLLDSASGHRKEYEITGQPAITGKVSGDIRQGFVYERAPHTQLRDIARNEEIDEIWHRWQPEVVRSLAALNLALRGHSPGFMSPIGGRSGAIVDFSADEGIAVAL
ncbi:MAG: site-specific DNA-methyltransferase, partial [Rhodospirillaceae bacterium]|nr:site-specific DNA-methyltransferase [Rhodospirillaceae bacterium]